MRSSAAPQASPAQAQFPEIFDFLFEPIRYKVAYGSRASAKSWSFARALLMAGAFAPLRILCTREVQKSIKDSVHQLLREQIAAMGLGGFYEVLDTEIRGVNGTEFIFTGLSQHTVESIKSYEGVDRVWCEEAHAITKRSWDVLIPTIRKADSEIWISFNPELETDETYQRFVINPPPDTVSVHVTYMDNPYFSALMERERAHCERTQPDDYPNIWLGQCRPAVEGAIYYKDIQLAESEGRICNLPYDPLLKSHIVMDLGFNDSLSIGVVQRHLSTIRIIRHLEYSQTSLDTISAELRKLNLNWGKVWLPHDGFAKGLNAKGASTYDILKALGWDCARREEIVALSVEDGIRAARLKFAQCYFDKTHTNAPAPSGASLTIGGRTQYHGRLVECLKRYRRHVSNQTGEAAAPMKTAETHAADMFRYICVNADSMKNETDRKMIPRGVGYQVRDRVVGI